MSSVNVIKGQVFSTFVRPDEGVDVYALCTAIELDRTKLPKMIGVKRQSVSNYYNRGSRDRFIKFRAVKRRAIFLEIDRVYNLVSELIDLESADRKAKKEQISKWFHAPNKALGMRRPIDYVYEKKSNILIKKLTDALTAAQGG